MVHAGGDRYLNSLFVHLGAHLALSFLHAAEPLGKDLVMPPLAHYGPRRAVFGACRALQGPQPFPSIGATSSLETLSERLPLTRLTDRAYRSLLLLLRRQDAYARVSREASHA